MIDEIIFITIYDEGKNALENKDLSLLDQDR